jgi:BirA family transcriptional regulator, biotin operon repressor / biotin---[acetyl-CoA-carboxylase] ligase
MSAPFDSDRYLELVRNAGLTLGQPLFYSAVSDSTNDDALAAARSGGASGAVFVAEEQRRGRGRRGSEWHSTPGASLSFSVLLRPNVTADRASGLSLVAGLAVRQAVATLFETTGRNAHASVKWPNDVLLSGKKVAGILVESLVQAGKVAAAVVGIGLNVGRVALPSQIETRATSLAEEGLASGREELLVGVLGELASRLHQLLDQGRQEMLPKTLLAEFERHDALRGLRVSVAGKIGVAEGIDELGNLALVDEQGDRCRLAAGHVEILGGALRK